MLWLIAVVNRREATELGKLLFLYIIDLYRNGFEKIIENTPCIRERCTLNVEELRLKISSKKLFCDNLAFRIGQKILACMRP